MSRATKLADRPAQTSVPIHPVLAARWSTRAFADEDLSGEEIAALAEAFRWAPSCFNEQPWRVIFFDRSDAEARAAAESCLSEGNAWAKAAPLLALTVHATTFARNDKPNAHAAHDLGLADMSLVIQAHSMGLAVHQMAGFDREQARALFGVPEGWEPLVMIAIGRPGDPAQLPDNLREREQGSRQRKPLAEVARRGGFDGKPL